MFPARGQRHHRLPNGVPRKGHISLVLPQTHYLRWTIRKHQTHPNWGTFYKINGPYSLKNVNVLIDKERLRKCAKWKRKKEIRCLNAVLEGARARKEHRCSGITETPGKLQYRLWFTYRCSHHEKLHFQNLITALLLVRKWPYLTFSFFQKIQREDLMGKGTR